MVTRIKLRRGGKIVRVTENELAKYITKGYVRVDEIKKANEEQTTVPREPVKSTRTSKRKNKQ